MFFEFLHFQEYMDLVCLGTGVTLGLTGKCKELPLSPMFHLQRYADLSPGSRRDGVHMYPLNLYKNKQ